jgi:hypothetical protein
MLLIFTEKNYSINFKLKSSSINRLYHKVFETLIEMYSKWNIDKLIVLYSPIYISKEHVLFFTLLLKVLSDNLPLQ